MIPCLFRQPQAAFHLLRRLTLAVLRNLEVPTHLKHRSISAARCTHGRVDGGSSRVRPVRGTKLSPRLGSSRAPDRGAS